MNEFRATYLERLSYFIIIKYFFGILRIVFNVKHYQGLKLDEGEPSRLFV